MSHLQWDPEQGRVGPIIMTQIENEFGNYGYGDHPRDKEHLRCEENQEKNIYETFFCW